MRCERHLTLAAACRVRALGFRRASVRSAIVWLAFVGQTCGRSPVATVPVAPAPTTSTTSCGEERWSVKTLGDVDATRVDILSTTLTTVGTLNDLPPHCSALPETRT